MMAQTFPGNPPQPTILPQITFFQVRDNVPALKDIDIKIHFETLADTREKIISRVAEDPSWDPLDRVLTTSVNYLVI
ncbi:hypothetical protein D9619_006661 [Psilocybe cf. subviscida]|uniref:Uncharacterized protein n=1 Tax=Psilocybe cf. subviscida TaxID=2480587 RepID=A0A8H5B516_9AGAR|nr:hypothetical protein D9619_006661 [Psilocybe cf. subviscida]